jgi:hypothetical protein
MLIAQARVSPALAFFEEEFLRKYDLRRYSSPRDPALFFGCYGQKDIEVIRKHRGFRVVLWGGSDAMYPRNIKALEGLRDCFHIAISQFIERDLADRALPFVRLPVSPRLLGEDFAPGPKGPALYVYTSAERPEFYGAETVQKLREKYSNIEFITCTATSHGKAALIDVYRQCFLGLRLVPHDGLSNTVVELGLMGRRTVHNGGLPGSLPYSSFEEVCGHIAREQQEVGRTDVALADATRRFLELPPDWLTTEFYLRTRQAAAPASLLDSSVRILRRILG